MNYYEYINSNEWNDKKTLILNLKKFKCEKCWSLYELQIHHWSYKKLYNEPQKHLFILCNTCHVNFHKKYKIWKSMLNKTLNFIHWKWWRKKDNLNYLKNIYN